ncbi:MAG: Uma2 family endonuclease [Armatimonadota bacterium]
MAERPLTIDDYLRLTHEDDLYELIDGVLVEREMAAVWQHEQLFLWLARLVGEYVEAHQLGYVSGSRSAVKINEFRSRLPDLLFIRRERAHIITESIILEAPDWVLEIRSAGNRLAEWRALEADYRVIGVPELWLIDPVARLVRVVRRVGNEYEAHEQHEGKLFSTAIEGFWVELDWLFKEPRPKVREALAQLGLRV